VIVVDASVLAVAIADDGPDGDSARARLRSEDLAAPELVDLEVMSVLRRRALEQRRVVRAIEDLVELPLARAPHLPLLRRCWELRDNLTIYDAAYVALAEALEVPLVTADRRLSRAAGIRCPVDLLVSAPAGN